MLDGFVKRKVIKQTVMTTVYGVTRYGARLQIARQLKGKPSSQQDKPLGIRNGEIMIFSEIKLGK